MMLTNRLFPVVCLIVAIGGMSLGAPGRSDMDGRRRSAQKSDPNQVFFLVYVLDIDDINAQSQSFAVNMYIGLRWKDERLAHSEPVARTLPLEDVWSPRLLLANQKGLVRTSLPEVVEVQADGTVEYRQRYVGAVSQPIHLADFPRDRHTFTVHFVATRRGTKELQFLPDRFPGSEKIVGGAMAETLSLPDWKILSFAAKEQAYRVVDDFQQPGFVFTFVARRNFGYYLRQMILPQILIVMMSWAAFWIDPSMAGTQISLSMTSMLTLIAHRFLLASQLPRLPYMTRMDNFIMMSTILVFAVFVEVVTTSSLARAGRTQLGKAIDHRCRIAFPVIFACIMPLSFSL